MLVGWEVGGPCHNWRTIRPHGTTSASGNVLASVQYTEALHWLAMLGDISFRALFG